MIISGAAIHCDGHGKCGLLVTQTFLHFLAGLAAPPPSFYRHRVSTNLSGISLINSQRTLTAYCNLSCPAGNKKGGSEGWPAGPVGLGETSY